MKDRRSISHDPLPESSFFWRRLTTWFISVALLSIIAWNVWALHDLRWGDGIASITYRLIILLGIVLTYYLVAPSAEQIIRLIQLSKVWRSGALAHLVDEAPSHFGAPDLPLPPIPPAQAAPNNPDDQATGTIE